VTEKTMRTYYDADPSRFVVPEQAQYRQILIAVDPGGSGRLEGCPGWAAELAKQARGRRSPIWQTRTPNTSEPEQGEDMGWVHRGQLDHDESNGLRAEARRDQRRCGRSTGSPSIGSMRRSPSA
jgi:hypothetical protein